MPSEITGETAEGKSVVVSDMEAFDAFYKRLVAAAPMRNVTSRFSMERIKASTVLPLSTSEAA